MNNFDTRCYCVTCANFWIFDTFYCHFKTMPATRDNSKNAFSRTISNSSISMSAKVYHPATNLMPPSPPQSPTGVAPPFGTSRSSSTNSFSRQNSQTSGKYS